MIAGQGSGNRAVDAPEELSRMGMVQDGRGSGRTGPDGEGRIKDDLMTREAALGRGGAGERSTCRRHPWSPADGTQRTWCADSGDLLSRQCLRKA